MFDPINPAHYIEGRAYEVIDVIEDNISRAPDTMAGFHQGQALKYLCRVWDKGDPLENLKKMKWYVDKLVTHVYVSQLGDKADKKPFDIPQTILGGPDEFTIPFDNSPTTYEEVCRLASLYSETDTAPCEYEAYFSNDT